MYDLCIIGGGAAGISCAITAGRLGLKVIIIEKNNKLGKKLYATGNGRCNITNLYMDVSKCYNSSDTDYVKFMNTALGDNPTTQVVDFLESFGIPTMNINGYVYPKSAQASSLVWAMLDVLKAYNVEILLNKEITSIEYKSSHFEIKSLNEPIRASQMVLATGGMSYKSLGGTESGYTLSKKLKHTIIPIRQALCGLTTDVDLEPVSGVRVNARASFTDHNKCTYEETGELQITSSGLSGIMIFNLSSRIGASLQNKKVNLYLDLIPDTGIGDFHSIIANSFNRTVIGLLNSLINDKLAAFICTREGIDRKCRVSDMSKDTLDKLFTTLKAYKIKITGLFDYEKAQVCAGGVAIGEICPKTFMSKKQEGLYIVGELLDIDGICGGYNLTFALLSGIRAGRAVYDKNKSN